MTIGGIGGGLNSTCAMAIITSMFPNEKELYIGILEAAVGIGLLIGPLLGAFLYSVGGFKLPFWTVAAICITLYPLLIHTNKFIVQKERDIALAKEIREKLIIKEATTAEEDDIKGTGNGTKEIRISFMKLCTVPLFVFGLLA